LRLGERETALILLKGPPEEPCPQRPPLRKRRRGGGGEDEKGEEASAEHARLIPTLWQKRNENRRLGGVEQLRCGALRF
jgi:hypothetical protein